MTKRLSKHTVYYTSFISALFISIQLAYCQIPEVKLDPLTVSIRTDTRGFQGAKPKDEEFVKYSLLGQRFLPDGIDLRIPTEPIETSNLASILTNPYATLLASLYVDKVSEKAGRLALSTPGCKESITALLEDVSFEEFSKATQKLMEGVGSVKLLLLVEDEQSGRLYAYYRLIKPNGNKGGPIYIRSFENINDMYFVSCSPIASPMPLNVWNALISGTEFYSIN